MRQVIFKSHYTVSDRTRKKRVMILSAFIASLPKRKFDIGDWGSTRKRSDLLDGPIFTVKQRIREETGRFCLTSREVQKLGTDAKGDWSLVCNTRFCIAGWVCFLWPKLVDPQEDIEDNAKRILGLDHDEAEELFYPSFGQTPKDTPKRASEVIATYAVRRKREGTFGELER